ncbi:MAG: 23S rRNA (uracil(1939)-C(5))-methyltransferase RlmD [bacterium]|nr:23S rRNA (uracil(1939)-C(5))-methyltransferase RlmD [bacterium]
MNMNDYLDCLIIDEDNYGNGIAKIDNFVIFIKGAFLNEKVKIKIIKKEKHFAIGKLVSVENSSPKRKKIKCPYFYDCGGCNYLHLEEKEELDKKQDYLNSLFNSYKVNKIESVNCYNYRNKVVLHVENKKLGFYLNDTNYLVEIDKCLLISDTMNNLINILKKFDLGKITKIMIRETFYTKEILISFYGDINNADLKKLNNYNIKSIYLNNKLIKYNKNIREKINNLEYIIGNNSFFQVNTLCMEKLYQKIKEYAGSGDKLLDLYCGTGTIGMFLKDNFKNVLGVEVVKEAISNANENKKINNIENIDFICDDAKIIKNKSFSCVIVDPPRNGLSKDVIDNLKNIKTEKLIYVSCNPKTLKKDLLSLEDKYNVIEITPFNMFPRTNDVECVSLLYRKKLEK